MERLDLTHAMMVKCLGGRLFLSPLEEHKLAKVIDLGTGTGICKWRIGCLHYLDTNSNPGAIEFGDMFPNAEVYNFMAHGL